MEALVPIVMFGWPVIVLFMFAALRPRRAVIASYLIAWLFLPMKDYPLPALPDYTKMSATSMAAMLGVLIFDASRLLDFRPKWFDIPMGVLCVWPFFTSIGNGLGAYDGASAVLNQTILWGVPYFVGRIYFTRLEHARELAMGMLIGGLVYVPLCLIEIKMSPQLHVWVYGFHQADFSQSLRYGGWRPTVFMQHGLMVGVWMMSTSVIGVWLWATGALKELRSTPVWVPVGVLMATNILCKSTGALAIMVGGLAALFATRWLKTRLVLLLLILAPWAYLGARTIGGWTGQNLVDLAAEFSEDRATSLKTRVDNEKLLMDNAKRSPLIGVGSQDWNAYYYMDESGEAFKYYAIPDALWVIVFTRNGAVAMVCVFLILTVPALQMLRNLSAKDWGSAMYASLTALTILLILYAIDNLFNAMVNPVFGVATGAVATLSAPEALRAARRRRHAQVRQAAELRRLRMTP